MTAASSSAASYPYKGAVVASLAACLLWLTYVVASAQRHVPTFHKLFEGLGGELPNLTTALLASYQWWWLAPVVFAGLAVDIIRRPAASPRYFAVVVTLLLVVSFALLAWMHEGVLLPLRHILDSVG